jgi:hypothetical protein
MGKIIYLEEKKMGSIRDIGERSLLHKIEMNELTPEEERRVFEILARSGQIDHYKKKPRVRWRRVIARIIFGGFAVAYWTHGVVTGNWFSF